MKSEVGEERGFLTARYIVMLSVFTALSYVLYMFVKFPLPGFPGFLDMQISDVPALLAGFMLGPSAGAAVILIKCLFKIPFTSTACVGELGDIIIGMALVLPAAFIYKRHRTLKGAVAGLAVGIVTSTAAAVLVNRIILIPAYMKLMFNGNWEILLNMMRSLFPSITANTFYAYYLPLSVLPFNLLRGIISAIVTFLLYKSLERAFDRIMPRKKNRAEQTIHNHNG